MEDYKCNLSPSFIDEELFKRTLTNYEQNHFVQWLVEIVGKEHADRAIGSYFIGTSENGGTVFWQIDLQGNMRTGKIIMYDNNGCKQEDVTLPLQWMHSVLNLPNFNLSQVLFGEHLLKDNNKPVAIVESEKTAIIGSIYLPDMIWLACGSNGLLHIDKCRCLQGRSVILYPDSGCYNEWSEKASELSKICNVGVSTLEQYVPEQERQSGFDIADYFVRKKPQPMLKPMPQPCLVAKELISEVPKIEKPNSKLVSIERMLKYYTKMPYFTDKHIRLEDWDVEMSYVEAWLASTTLPDTPFRLSPCETITDCQLFIDSHLATVKMYDGNPNFRSCLERLINLILKIKCRAMFDYIEFSKKVSDDYFDDSKINGYNELIDNYSPMKVSYNKEKNILTIKGSLAYFFQGHNFWFEKKDFEKAINRMSELLGVDLYDAEVNIIEYGTVVTPNFSMEDFIKNHLKTRGYEENTYGSRGKSYIRSDKSYTLKFYSLWANIDNSKNKVNSEIREILKRSCFGREHNPMRYEIHGNPQKILKRGKVYVSDLLSEEFEEQLKEMLLKKYRQIKKWEPLRIQGTQRCDSVVIALALLSEKDNRYQEKIMALIDTLKIKKDAKLSRKTFFRKKFREVPHGKCSCSIENLIMEAFEI